MVGGLACGAGRLLRRPLCSQRRPRLCMPCTWQVLYLDFRPKPRIDKARSARCAELLGYRLRGGGGSAGLIERVGLPL